MKPSAEQIKKLQVLMSGMPQWDAQQHTGHYFADGMYMRTLWRPAGTTIVGKVHKKEHLFILAQGEMTIWTEDGMRRIKAPFVMVSQPGTKRVTYAHEDSMGITVHRAEGQDLSAIESELVEDDPLACFGPGNSLKALEHT